MDDGRTGAVGADGAVAPDKDIAVSQVVSQRRRSLAAVRLRDVDDFLIFKGANGWSRKSACGYADALRAFFRYAEQRGWCKPGIAEGIISPRMYAQEGLPEGPKWKDVQRLLKEYKGEQRRRAACQSRLVPPGGLRVAQRGDIASAVERLRLARGDVHGEPLQTRRRAEVSSAA